MLGDPDRAGAQVQRSAGLLGRQPDGHPQQQDLALLVGQGLQQAAGQVGVARPHGQRLGAVGQVDRVRDVGHGRRPPAGGPVHVGQLAGRDRVDEGLERHALVPIARQGRQHRDAHLLRRVVSGAVVAERTTEAGADVAVHHPAHRPQQVLGRCRVPTQRLGHQTPQIRPDDDGVDRRCHRGGSARRYTS